MAESAIPWLATARTPSSSTSSSTRLHGATRTDFEGSVHCTAPEGMMFTGVALEMDFNNRIFTTLPVVPVQ